MEIVERFEEDLLDGIFDVSSVLSLAYFIPYKSRNIRVAPDLLKYDRGFKKDDTEKVSE